PNVSKRLSRKAHYQGGKATMNNNHQTKAMNMTRHYLIENNERSSSPYYNNQQYSSHKTNRMLLTNEHMKVKKSKVVRFANNILSKPVYIDGDAYFSCDEL
ncbi:unnamed protein product, partial [Rotaria sordida]